MSEQMTNAECIEELSQAIGLVPASDLDYEYSSTVSVAALRHAIECVKACEAMEKLLKTERGYFQRIEIGHDGDGYWINYHNTQSCDGPTPQAAIFAAVAKMEAKSRN
jgi:hypothetical protein